MSEDEFVAAVTEGQPARPHYFEYDAQRNRELHPLLDVTPPILLDVADVLARRDYGAALLDVREPNDFAAGHLHGAVNVGLQGRFAEWAGDVLAPDRDVILVGDPAGFPDVSDLLGGYGAWEGAGLPTSRGGDVEIGATPRVGPRPGKALVDSGALLLDVREPDEWQLARVADAVNVPMGQVRERQ